MSKPKKANLELTMVDNEARIDSRLMAERLGIGHRPFFRMLNKHLERIEEFGYVSFQNSRSDAGREVRYALLNEDQAVLVLTFSKNTDPVMDLKVELTKRFSAYRKKELAEAKAVLRRSQREWQAARIEGKEDRRELTDSVQVLQRMAEEQGSKNGGRYFGTITRMIYKELFGLSKVPKGFRDELPAKTLRLLQMVERQVAKWLAESLEDCEDYHEPYKFVKDKCRQLIDLIGKADLPQGLIEHKAA